MEAAQEMRAGENSLRPGKLAEERNRASISPQTRRLLMRAEVLWLLHLEEEQVQFLINTRQLVPIRIAGEERFDTREIDRLIDTYKSTATRRQQ